MPIIVNIAIYVNLIGKPYRELTGWAPDVEHLNIHSIVFLVREPYRRKVNPVIVGRVFVLLENEAAVDLFQQTIIKSRAVTIVVEFWELHIRCLASGAILCISRNMGIHTYLYSITG